jgi:hypothetical protein
MTRRLIDRFSFLASAHMHENDKSLLTRSARRARAPTNRFSIDFGQRDFPAASISKTFVDEVGR